MYFNLFEFEMF